MNIYASASLLAILVLLYWVMTEVFTVLFRLIGLPEEKARFQVVSLLTSCGFTTSESEMFLSTKSRRRLARICMLVGFIFNVAIVSILINVFLSFSNAALGKIYGVLIPLAAVTAVLILSRTWKIRKWLDRLIEQAAGKLSGNAGSNSIIIIDQIGNDCIAQVTLKHVPEVYRDKPLSQTGLKQEQNILVLLVERHDTRPATAVARTVFRDGDRLTVFGGYAAICAAFHAVERFTDDSDF